MNVHEVLVARRCAPTLINQPQTVDPTTLIIESVQTSTILVHEEDENDTDAACSSTSTEDTTDLKTTHVAGSRHQRKCSSDDGIHYVDDDDGVEFQLDARHLNRVHEELEKLNIATDVINKLELQLDHARERFREIHTEWSQRSEEIKKKYDGAIKKSRPYYEAIAEERKLREQAQAATIRFERANSMLHVAKQQVKLTQDSLTRQKDVQPECLEVLNHHVQRVNEAENERHSAEDEHRHLSHLMIQVTQRVKQLAKDNSRSIKKTRHYFDLHLEFRRRLDQQKQLISRLETEVKQKKRDYTCSLRNLEQISDSIHEERSLSSTKHSARTPDSARKSVSAVGLSKMQKGYDGEELDELESVVGDFEDLMIKACHSNEQHRRTASALTGADSHSTTSSSSGGISISLSHRDSMISEFCGNIDPTTMMFEDDFELHQRNCPPNGSTSELSIMSGSDGQRHIGSGVILLAQRLMGGSSIDKGLCSPQELSPNYTSEQDVRYHTTPAGILSDSELIKTAAST